MPYRNAATALQRYMYATLTRHEMLSRNPSVFVPFSRVAGVGRRDHLRRGDPSARPPVWLFSWIADAGTNMLKRWYRYARDIGSKMYMPFVWRASCWRFSQSHFFQTLILILIITSCSHSFAGRCSPRRLTKMFFTPKFCAMSPSEFGVRDLRPDVSETPKLLREILNIGERHKKQHKTQQLRKIRQNRVKYQELRRQHTLKKCFSMSKASLSHLQHATSRKLSAYSEIRQTQCSL